MPLSNLLHILALIASVSGLTLHESRAVAPAGFVRRGAAPESEQLTLRLALTAKNITGLEETMRSISTPGTAVFRQWLSTEEIKSFVEPSSETLAAFNRFATANALNATSISPHNDWVSLTLPVSQANKLFGTRYEKYSHRALAHPITRTLSISLPPELVGHVEVIYPSTNFFASADSPLSAVHPAGLQQRWTPAQPAASCNTSDPNGAITPSCLQELYGIPKTPTRFRTKNNRLLVTGFQGTSLRQNPFRYLSPFTLPSCTELVFAQDFLEKFRPDMPRDTGVDLIRLGDGSFGTNSTNSSAFDVFLLEADLDIQYSVGLATGIPVDFLALGGGELQTQFMDMISFLEGLDDPPSVISTSFAFNEIEVGDALAKKLCNGFMSLGARGISVIFAAGDGGVRGNHDNSTQCDLTTFIPVFPSSCPWVTAVGGTQGFSPEIAVNLTSGGFSNIFPRPWYQDSAVESFLSTIPQDFPGTFNRTGRGYPDVAVQGNNFAFISQKLNSKIGGTSLSAPTFASIIALVNDRLISAGKERLGFLNPWLYKNQVSFTDITAGRNPGFLCPASSVAFEAVKGWDALTGIGTPVFNKLVHDAFDACDY